MTRWRVVSDGLFNRRQIDDVRLVAVDVVMRLGPEGVNLPERVGNAGEGKPINMEHPCDDCQGRDKVDC